MNQDQLISPNQALWEKGDFTKLADTMRESGDQLVRTLGIEEGMKVLDLGCGDGTTALPAALLRANVLGVDVSRNLVAAGTKRAQGAGLDNLQFIHGTAFDLQGIEDNTFDRVVSIFGAMFAPRPFDVASEMVRVAKPGATITMGNWIPNDPTLVAQVLRVCSAYMPAPPEGTISPMTWGFEENVIERFTQAGIAKENITCERETYVFHYDSTPEDYVNLFRDYYGPTMNAFEAAEEKGKADQLYKELVDLFESQNQSKDPKKTLIPATFLRVTARV
ncbi:MAG: methyltransferase domain-containing protein [Bdellovibrionales bacterium]|nr:methyltransferase domain-containing protein [Bdellovibrionales bacterium]